MTSQPIKNDAVIGAESFIEIAFVTCIGRGATSHRPNANSKAEL